TITSVTPSASQTLSVAFTAPSSDGGSTISNYQYSLNGGASWTTRSPVATSSPLVITGLANGSSYTVVLRAVNVNGGGTSSNAVAAIPGVPPSAPTISSVSTADTTLSVVFSAPASNGSIAITNYEYSTDGNTWTARTPASTASPLVITGLANGTSYTVRIRAVNPAGSGASSSSASGTPSRTPDAPTIDSIEPSSGRLRVSYTAPTFNGGATITNYEYSTDNGTTWTALNPVNTSGSFSITSLVNARTYTVRVRAVNLRGAGTASAAVDATPATTPGAPTISGIIPSNGRLDVAFVPGADGGATPTNYQWSTDDGTTWVTRSPAAITSPMPITGLANGTTYAVRIRSVNSQGAGGASAASDGTPATTPGAPTIGGITAANARLSVAVTAGSTGGAAVTNYEYSTDNGATWTIRTPASAASPIVIGGLQNGTDYAVRVRAVNSQGAGTASSATQARPATTPGAPTIDGISGDPGQVTIAFTAPTTDGGNTISNYEYSTNGGATWTTRSPAATTSPIVVTGLVDGTVYPVRIRAVNAQGGGTQSASVEGTPVNTPGAPTINNVISGSGFLRIDFSAAPARGATVTNYEYSLDNGQTWTTPSPAATTSPLTVNNLTNGTPYQIVLRGVNSRGSGVSSTMTTGTPSAPPSAPTISGIQVGNVSGSLSVAFTAGASGGAAITDTEYSVDGGTSWASAGSAVSPVTITGLTNGSTYSVKLRSVNVRGAGTASGAVSGTPIWVPGSPSLSSVTGSDQTLTLIFSPPADTGGSTITNYEYSTNGGTTWTTRSPVSTARPLVVTGLVNGTAYNVAVRAVNAKGSGISSNTIGAKPATVP
ncbi:MAG: fibronectin type III domain-containing protein, partial [Actinomycetota bacterium]